MAIAILPQSHPTSREGLTRRKLINHPVRSCDLTVGSVFMLVKKLPHGEPEV
jgi:hypothetical protein